jgi:hypothetical protein
VALAAALLVASVGLCLSEARAQANKPLPPAPQEEQGERPLSTPDAAPDASPPLSEELKRSEGVIAPPDPGVDPGMVKPPPDTGAATTMPVIPPPGTPGGDPNIRPQ